MNKRLISDPQALERLLATLSKYACVRRFDEPDEPEAARLTHAFADIEDSLVRLQHVHLPNILAGALTEQEMADLLTEIGEEFRHILYHVRDTRYFRDLA
ncbi:MAG: hypothetical protein FJX68_01425 [Alphaproteobacteria bacterium]|nr:hypothetical protein [Alphaproteobacteria bacterium]